KPFTASIKEAETLIELAERKKLTIMVDHTFIFTGAVRKMKKLIDEKALGDLYYYDSVRVNLGLFQHDVNVIWDLAPHDFAIMDYLVDERPAAVTACGKAHISGMEDTAYVTVHFNNNMIAHFNVNWLSPVKVRTTLIGGEKKMLVWNDLEPDEKIKIYDKGVEVKSKEATYKMLVNYRTGDMHAPRVEQVEALKMETEYFINCIQNSEKPQNDGHAGLRVVKMLDACNQSLRKSGQAVTL
ncbi:MAG TPA: Gfo/Idh/MocA family oxidoreductase, partial [Nitrospirota bacterium]